MDKLLQDLRFAGRSLTKSPAYTAVVVITLGLAIGANSTIFSLVNGVLLRPLPYEDPERIVQVVETAPRMGDELQAIASQPLFLAWRDDPDVFEHLAMYSSQSATLRDLEEPVRLAGAAVSPALFPLLGVDAHRGRTFAPEEEMPGSDNVVILGHRAWQRYFGGSDDVLGRSLRLDETPRVLVGVMPPGFAFPDPTVEYWVPLRAQPIGEGEDPEEAARRGQMGVVVREERTEGPEGGGRQMTGRRGGGPGGRGGAPGGGGPGGGGPGGGGPGGGGPGGRGPGGGPGGGPQAMRSFEMWGRMIGRLQEGVTIERAAEQGTALARGLRAGEQNAADRSVELVVLQDLIVGPVRPSLLILMGAVGFVLLIACANVANLVLARSTGRTRETAVRAALGAGRWEIARLLLAESVSLAMVGGALGLLLAWWGLRLVAGAGPELIPRLGEVAIDVQAIGFTFLVALVTGVLFSLAPARSARALDLAGALKEESGTVGFTRGLGRDAFRKLLVVAELALAVMLLVGAGLLVSSFVRLVTVDPGYDPTNLLQLQVDLPEARYPDAISQLDFYDRLIGSLERLEGVDGATLTNQPPSMPSNMRIAVDVQGPQDEPADREPSPVGVRVVENDYFDVLGIRPLRGRLFDDNDRSTTQPVAILSESGVRNLFGDRDPLGTRLRFLGPNELEIVGIVADVRQAGVDPAPQPDIFLVYRQAPERMVPMILGSGQLLVRTGPAPLSLVPAVRTQLRQVDPEVTLLSVSTVRDRLAESIAEPRFYATVVGAFAVLALALAAVGVYGLLAYMVQQRVRETAIRKALGARAGQVLALVLRQAVGLAVVGLLLGLAGSVALTRLLEAMLYEIEPTDPLTLTLVAAIFLAVAVVAILVPARRALGIDPMQVLRYE